MLAVPMTEDDLDDLMKCYFEEKKKGRFRYFWEISIPDSEYPAMMLWLEECEKLGFEFAFAELERYENYKLLYGFSNFEFIHKKGVKFLELKFENDDVLYLQFMEWREESSCFIMTYPLKFCIELMKKLSSGDI